MDELERRANWWVERDRPLVQRVYRFAEGMMGLKEFESTVRQRARRP